MSKISNEKSGIQNAINRFSGLTTAWSTKTTEPQAIIVGPREIGRKPRKQPFLIDYSSPLCKYTVEHFSTGSIDLLTYKNLDDLKP